MYVAAFDDEGFEDATLLDDANLDMLTNEMKMKSGHARKLLKYLEKQGILATTDSNVSSFRFVYAYLRYVNRSVAYV